MLSILLGPGNTKNMNHMVLKELSLEREINNYNVIMSIAEGYPLNRTK